MHDVSVQPQTQRCTHRILQLFTKHSTLGIAPLTDKSTYNPKKPCILDYSYFG